MARALKFPGGGGGWAPDLDSDYGVTPPWDDARLETDPSDRPATLNGEGASSPEASRAFLVLIDHLVQQHVREVASARNLGPGEPHQVTLKIPEEPPSSSTKRGKADFTGSESEPLNVLGRQQTRDRDHIPHIDASQLLHALSSEDDKRLNAYMASYVNDDVDDLDLFMKPIETESEHRARLSQMTRLERFADWLESAQYEMLIAGVLCFNVLWMALEAQVDGYRSGHAIKVFQTEVISDASWKSWELVFAIGDVAFTVFFVLDVVVRILVLRCKFWAVPMNYIDIAVSMTSLLEIVLFYVASANLAVNPILFRLLRIGKLARAIRMITMNSVLASLHLLIRCLAASTNILFWTFCLIAFFQCVSGMVANTLCRDFINDESQPMQVREDVFRYYGTFTRTFLSMFELLFANWSPPCRVLVENISEWFSIYFLLYRCVLGYAVLNVVSAVFVQQTMKTASSDEELAFKQKERDIAMYTRKVRRLFQTMDVSGDGVINYEEFSKLVKSPMLKFWMSQLELEYHDLMSLFEFLDNGDGEITLMEFIEGAARLRGGAKALDIWRIETKVELLFQEVLSAIQEFSQDGTSNTVGEVFSKAKYRHINAAARVTGSTESLNKLDPGNYTSEARSEGRSESRSEKSSRVSVRKISKEPVETVEKGPDLHS